MTHDTHTPGSSRPTGRRHPRPDLGRPSLFADFDQASVQDIEPQRIRLLSTLESQRGGRAHPRARRLPTGHNRPWLTRSLMVVMGVGMLVMLLSFIQVLKRPPPSIQPPSSLVTNGVAANHASQHIRARGPADLTEPIQAAEIIDMSPPAAGPAPGVVIASPLHTAHEVIELGANQVPIVAAPSPAEAPATPSRQAVASATGAERNGRKAAHPGEQGPETKPEAGASHEDVALVEAMLAHASPRPAQPSPAVSLQQCGTGNAPEVAVCRARICVRNPSLAACHAP